MGARLRWASLTIRTICANIVSLPTRSAVMTSTPVPLTVAPTNRAPATFSTGIGSPVIIDSSTALRPSITTPSTGTRSPGRTRSVSPTTTRARGTSSSLSSTSSTRCATSGASPSSDLNAAPVWWRARSSRTCPSSTSTMITTEVSKYGSTLPSVWNPTGKICGAIVAPRL